VNVKLWIWDLNGGCVVGYGMVWLNTTSDQWGDWICMWGSVPWPTNLQSSQATSYSQIESMGVGVLKITGPFPCTAHQA
jgi:hypothetical protein